MDGRIGYTHAKSTPCPPIGMRAPPEYIALHDAYLLFHVFACFVLFEKSKYGTTLLMVASYAGHIDCVKELVLQGADINLQRESGTTALFFAAQQGHNDVVRFLFEFGASTEFRTKDGGTALLAASQYGHMRVVDTLLKHGANIHDQLYDGATALFLAAQGGYLDVIRLLLSSGAKVNQPRQDGTAPLWIASQMGHSEVVRVMLLRGADRDAARDDGTTALLKAANKGYNDVIEELLKFSPTLGILKNGTSALHAAVLSGNIKTVALLLEAGADPALRNKMFPNCLVIRRYLSWLPASLITESQVPSRQTASYNKLFKRQ
ncbi:PREDICTED: ankyrin repeat domain-containing protein 29 isoform X1 [Hipposideros armiger]|uniref:Ankyrin repeat domain-containing protein 29 isoform X1 n=2 Tax=Hipposideros armiger TaxID=186990 RepID=A0A8B7S7U7_HIPAR|nr:PREDICTED: ankyrin repeat domain-containing protein 29 isoform X1 [Hipposideros armiger]